MSCKIFCREKRRAPVWKNENGKTSSFKEIFNFEYGAPPMSMACHNGDFYIGMGDRSTVNRYNGMILYIDYTKE